MLAKDNSLKVQVTNRQILKIALPISAALIIPNVNFITNNIFLGGLGEKALGNAGITGVYYLIMMVSGSGLSSAIQALISRRGGEGSTEGIHKMFTQGIRISLFFSAAWMLVTYFLAPLCLRPFIKPENFAMEMNFLRIRIWGLPFLYLFQSGNAFLIGTLNSRYMMIGTIGEALINIFLDYALIYGAFSFPQLGFNGAAVASVIAEFSGMAIVYIVIFKKGLKAKFNLFSDLKYDRESSNEIVKMSAPLVLQFSISLITWLFFFILLEQYGETAKAVSNSMRNVFNVVGIFVWAFASTCNTMVSNVIGQKKEQFVIPLINRITALSFSFTLFVAILLNLFPHAFFSMFSHGTLFSEEAIPVLRVVTLGMLGLSVALIWLNGVTGTGNTRVNLMIEVIAVGVYIAYIYVIMIRLHLSLTVAWGNEFIYWAVIFIASFSYLKWGKWRKRKERVSTL